MESPERPPPDEFTTSRDNGAEEESALPPPPPRIVHPPQDEPSPHSHSIPVHPSDGGGEDAPLDLDVLVGGDRYDDDDGGDDGLPRDPLGLGTRPRARDAEEFNSLTWVRRRLGWGPGAAKDDDGEGGLNLPTRRDEAQTIERRARDEDGRKLRQRQQLDRRLRPWTLCGVEVARAWERAMEWVLPESMRTVHVEAGSRRWYITDRALELWALLRRPIFLTLLALLAATLLWVAATFLVVLVAPAPPEVPPSLRDVGGGLGVPARVDGAGVYMERPLAICGLLYDRREHARRRDEAWGALYRDLYPDLAERVAQSGLRARGEGAGAQVMTRSNVLLVDPKALNGPRTALPPHQDSKRWRLLRESGAVWPTPSRRDARMFHDKTRAWLARECGRAPGRDAFIRDAKERGYLRLDVTDYIEPPPREPTPPPPPQDAAKREGETPKSGGEAEEESEFDALLQLEEEEEEEEEIVMGREEGGKEDKEGGEARMLAPPPPEPLYRNVSIYDLNMALFHFAAQARDARAEWPSPPRGLAAALAGALLDALARFRTAARVEAPGVRGGADEAQAHYQRLALQSHAEAKVRALLGETVGLRSHALWSGADTGCVCPHHVGVPVPGAAWYEPADRARGTPARVRVLFYATLDTLPAGPGYFVREVGGPPPSEDGFYPDEDPNESQNAPKEEEEGDSGWLGWLPAPLAELARGKPAAPAKPSEPPPLVEWDIHDPVLEDEPWMPLRLAQHAPEPRVRLGGRSEGKDDGEGGQGRYWVEGVTYDGWQRRYPISAAAYACVASCQLACGDGGEI